MKGKKKEGRKGEEKEEERKERKESTTQNHMALSFVSSCS